MTNDHLIKAKEYLESYLYCQTTEDADEQLALALVNGVIALGEMLDEMTYVAQFPLDKHRYLRTDPKSN